MKEVNLSLKVEEINLLLTALGNLPFIQVHELIANIQTQATPQLNNSIGGSNHQKAVNAENQQHS